MKTLRKNLTGVLAALGMLLLILDARTALSGASDGVLLCIYTVIPSLFPFLLLSILISSSASGKRITPLRPIGRLLGIPEGAEYLLILSLLGGYPVGAQAVAQAWSGGSISKQTAWRLLGFCSNAGPAFIFGLVGGMFSNWQVSWLLWLIHFGPSILVGLLLPGKTTEVCAPKAHQATTIVQALKSSLRVMAAICGWVVLFRTVLSTVGRWLLWLLPVEAQTLICGLLELSNGCVALANIPHESLRFQLAAVMLSFGGLCVAMQTQTVTGALGTGLYFPGKLLQSVISLLLASIAQHFLFRGEPLYHLPVWGYIAVLCTGCIVFLCLHRRKKVVALSV